MASLSQYEKHSNEHMVICRRCCVKVGKNRGKLTDRLRLMYSEHFKQDLNDPYQMLPVVVCVTCKPWLEKVHGGNPKAGKLPKDFIWPVPTKNTRLSMCRSSNPCIMCNEASDSQGEI